MARPRAEPAPVASFTWEQVLAWRLSRQHLESRAGGGSADASPAAVVGRLCGVQAQVASAAELAVAARRQDAAPGDLDRELWQERSVVKCWAMRGTLHVLPAAELPTYTATLSTARFWEAPAWGRYHGVGARDVDRIRAAAADALEPGLPLTREQLGAEVMERARSSELAAKLASGWGELLKPLAFMGELCNGPPSGARVTFVRPDRWLQGWRPVPPEVAGPAVVRAYLGSHGPASVAETAAWWCRARPPAVRPWFHDLEPDLVTVDVEGRRLWALACDCDSIAAQECSTVVRLLPNFDQYVLAAGRDVAPLVPPAVKSRVFRAAGWVSPVVIAGGRVAGIWKLDRGRATVAVELFEPVGAGDLEAEVAHLGNALGIELGVAVVDPR